MYRADGPEALRCVGETEFVNGVAAMTASGIYGDVRACLGIVGHVNLKQGAEVVELYIRDTKPQIDRPIRELKGFERVMLKPGETRTVSFSLEPQAARKSGAITMTTRSARMKISM